MNEQEIHVDIDGRRLYGFVTGAGEPTVVIEAGLGDSSQTWLPLLPQIASRSRVFTYDRAGLGRSDPAPTPRDCKAIGADLRRLLAEALLPPPYILVAHSWSGIHARWYANTFPEEIAGMVLVDAVHEGKYKQFAEVMDEARAARMWDAVRNPAKNDEQIDRLVSIAQMQAGQRRYEFPLVVLTRRSNGDPLDLIETDLQADFLQLSSRSCQYFSQFDDHWIQNAEPDLVLDGISQALAWARQ